MRATTAVRCSVVAACFLAAAVYLGQASRAETLPPREPLVGLPMLLDDWRGRPEPDLEPEIVSILGVDDYTMRGYTRPSEKSTVWLYIGYHDSQRQGDTIHSPLNCLPGAGWTPLEQDRLVIPVQAIAGASPTAIEVNRVVVGKGLNTQLVLYWYQSHRRIVASEYWGKVYTVLDAIRYNRTDAALVRVVAPVPVGSDVEAAERQAVSFVQTLFPHLGRHLPS